MNISSNNNEISILINQDEKNIENYIIQFEESSVLKLEGEYTDFQIIFDLKNKQLNIKISDKIYYFIIDRKISNENFYSCIGLSKRIGDFEIKKGNSNTSFFDLNINKLSSNNSTLSMSCTSGGTGATECSVNSTIGPVSTGCQVSCGTGYYACCNDDTTVCKCIAKSKSISQERFSLMINPTKDLIKFEGSNFAKHKIRIFNMNGEMFIDNIVLTNEINISKLTPNIYIYHIYDENGYEQEGKLIIKN
ncbi:T9SS type A sorting domain-containing protein [Flavobacterium urocaniciphilum]|nr:T9SS type A sorting domain-containing protein [Flavobacterium urocaniciphilum]